MRPEHPKPQFRREEWMNLNGNWNFEIDNSKSGEARGLYKADAKLSGVINVPFCPESKLSGVEEKDFIYGLWYQKKVTLSEEQCRSKVFLHFGAVDYECSVFINGNRAGGHKGGYVSFSIDITEFVCPGENVVTVFAADDTRDPMIPSGKQSCKYNSAGCYYTRTTGIWQTVWLEFVPDTHIRHVRYATDIKNQTVVVTADTDGRADLDISIFYEGRKVGSFEAENLSGQITAAIVLSELHLWEIGEGRIYDVLISFGKDKVHSYFGMRSVCIEDGKFLLNGKSVFQRLILDQGFYPDGIYTAPTDEALRKDIDISLQMGFNGCRAHEKVFEERWLYHCDKAGYLVWGEYPNWGLDHSRPEAIYSILPEWLEEISRDINHPSIIGWCPFNETWNKNGHPQYDELIRQIYHVTKAADPSRPCIDTSGFFHVETDVYDVHDYEQNAEIFENRYKTLSEKNELCELFDPPISAKGIYEFRQKRGSQPVFMSEFGGIRWAKGAKDEKSWGYGADVLGEEDFKTRFSGLVSAVLNNKNIFGFCYTQLTDVEQEQNGLYTYERTPKFDVEWVRKVVSKKAAVED